MYGIALNLHRNNYSIAQSIPNHTLPDNPRKQVVINWHTVVTFYAQKPVGLRLNV
jgi:hypothetical protein